MKTVVLVHPRKPRLLQRPHIHDNIQISYVVFFIFFQKYKVSNQTVNSVSDAINQSWGHTHHSRWERIRSHLCLKECLRYGTKQCRDCLDVVFHWTLPSLRISGRLSSKTMFVNILNSLTFLFFFIREAHWRYHESCSYSQHPQISAKYLLNAFHLIIMFETEFWDNFWWFNVSLADWILDL